MNLSRIDQEQPSIEDLIRLYNSVGTPLGVSFRSLVRCEGHPDRITSLIHPYPAKVLPHIPQLFVNDRFLSDPTDIVLDPFCGSGTVLLEAALAGRNAWGADANPLARLVSKVKTQPLPVDDLETALVQVLSTARLAGRVEGKVAPMLARWFSPRITGELIQLLRAVEEVRSDCIREFLLVSFSALLKRVSLADPRLAVPVKLREDKYPQGHPVRQKMVARMHFLEKAAVSDIYAVVVRENIRRMGKLNLIDELGSVEMVGDDSRNLRTPRIGSRLGAGTVKLVITSPPYAGAQKYIRASSLHLLWLGLAQEGELRELESASIGREHFRKQEYTQPMECGVPAADRLLNLVREINPLRAHIAAQYLIEMREALAESSRVLQRGGHMVLVVGNNIVSGHPFDTQSYLCTIAEEQGMRLELVLVDEIHSRSLMTKRNATASVIPREWILLFKK